MRAQMDRTAGKDDALRQSCVPRHGETYGYQASEAGRRRMIGTHMRADEDMSGIELFGRYWSTWFLNWPLSIWRAYVVSMLWGWFMVDGFDARPISVALALGLLVLNRVIIGGSALYADRPEGVSYWPAWFAGQIKAWTATGAALAAGALIHTFLETK